jgi:beta-lactamase class A
MQDAPQEKFNIPLKIFLALLVFILISFLIFLLLKKNPTFENFFLNSSNREKTQLNEETKMQTLILSEIAKLSGRWAIAVKNLKTGNTYLFNENETFYAASLYKLTVMWAVLDAIEKGQLKETDQIARSLESMITVSDNESAIALAERMGWANIESLMHSEGIGGFDLTGKGSPYTTANATLDLLERIYRNTAISTNASVRMKELLFAQKINDRIPKYLPQDVKVGHKTGELSNSRHDAGIIIGKNSHYIFVFLSETSSPQTAAETIANLSAHIYNTLEEN